ncbi:non-ribosomal peptide synthetase, partial [Spartinivicinus poritis]
TLELYLPLITGGELVVAGSADTLNPDALTNLLTHHQINVMQATPATWQMLISHGWQPSATLKMICGGEALNSALKTALQPEDSIELWNVYGPTETTVWSSVQRLTAKQTAITIGHPIANTQFYIVNSQMQPVPEGVTGELYIGGDGLARGYLNRPDLTAERFVPNPFSDDSNSRLYRTGDVARWLANGEIDYIGRIDHQVKIRGFRIELGEIEAALLSHKAVSEAVTCDVLNEEQTDRQLVSYIVLAKGDGDGSSDKVDNQAIEASVYQHLKAQLPAYMVPSALVVLDKLPLTPNGKVDRKALPKPTLQQLQQEYVAPATATEKALAELWAEVLGVTDSISREANFFEIGGQSLLIISLIRRVSEKLKVALQVKDIFAFPLLSQQADLINNKKVCTVKKDEASQLVIFSDEEHLPSLYCFPGLGGLSIGFSELSRSLLNKVNIKAFDAQGLFNEAVKFNNFEEMIDQHVLEIKRHLSTDSCNLAGHSFGGRVAFEVGRRLESEGINVTLFMLDVILSNNVFGIADQENEEKIKMDFILALSEWLGVSTTTEHTLDSARVDELSNNISLAMQEMGLINSQSFSVDDFWEVYKSQKNMNDNYLPSGKFNGDVYLLYCEELKPHLPEVVLDYQQWCSKVNTHKVMGEHHSMLNQENVDSIVNLIQKKAC